MMDPTRPPVRPISEYRFCRAKPCGSPATDRSSSSTSSSTSSPLKKKVNPTRPPVGPISENSFCRHKPYGPPAIDRSSSSTSSRSRQLDPKDPPEPSRDEEYRQLLRLPQDEIIVLGTYRFSFKISFVHCKTKFFFRVIYTYLSTISASIPTSLDSRQRKLSHFMKSHLYEE